MLGIDGRIAVVTGGSRGIGAAAATMLAEAGAHVAVLYSSDRESALKVCRRIENFARFAIAVRCRVEDYGECKGSISRILKQFGRIDILVNSAGIWEEGRIGAMSSRNWEKTIGINLTGTFNMCNLTVPRMKRQRFGRIINISSTAGQRGEPYHSSYAASKGGINAFTKSIAVELIRSGIRVNCVAPGWVRTDMVKQTLRKPRHAHEISREIPRGQIASPEEIAGPILFLASDLANHVVGEVLSVNGGSVLSG